MSIDAGGNALRREVELISAKAKRTFRPAEWRKVMRLAGWQAGMVFIDSFLAQRWNPVYAVQAGYSGKGGRDTIPYYERGQWVRNAMRAAPKVSASGDRLRLRIPVPAGHALTPKTASTFFRISDVERQAIAAAFAQAAAAIINGSSKERVTVRRTGATIKGARITKWVRNEDGSVTKKTIRTRGQKAVAIKSWTSRISDQDRNMTREISRGGFRAGRVATDLEERKKTLAMNHRANVKPRLTPGQLKKRHQEWHRTAGGAAGPTGSQLLSGKTRSHTYAGSRLDRHAQAQARYRAKYHSLRAATHATDAFISQSI